MEFGVATTLAAAAAEGLTPAPAPMCWAIAAASSRPGGMGRVVGLDIAWSRRAGSAAVVGPGAAWPAAPTAACVGDPTFASVVEGAEPAGGDGGRAASVLAPDAALELAPSSTSRRWVRPGSPKGEEGTAGAGRPADDGGVGEPAARPLCADLGPDAVAWSAYGGGAGLEGHGGTAAPDPVPAASEPQLQELKVAVASPGVGCSVGWWGTRRGVPDTVGLQGGEGGRAGGRRRLGGGRRQRRWWWGGRQVEAWERVARLGHFYGFIVQLMRWLLIAGVFCVDPFLAPRKLRSS